MFELRNARPAIGAALELVLQLRQRGHALLLNRLFYLGVRYT
ncbi:hypothetical protein [Vibrio vulnificus YJ016]|uniref:Uncharacterized protein n=1 Tax=Vibrio vulnificus (strain YJ016) TaxID=196600 RepID=Q7MDS9_VIBVY|nr:hypothetical protein [Vibrio vulnificus YJ016]